MKEVTVVGAGLAGSEAAYQIAIRGIPVQLIEMKPEKFSPAHHSENFAELVCSNSLRADRLENAVGLLKEELRRCGSLIMMCADRTRVEAGGALAVDRHRFSAMVTEKLKSHPLIRVVSKELKELPKEGLYVIATGPLTSDHLADQMEKRYGEGLHFYDAAAPLVSFDSIDMEKAFFGSRYDRGTPDYINCPMDEETYRRFVAELASAEQAPVHGFEDKKVFEGCMPVEVMARRGVDTLRYGPMKPVGLRDKRTGEKSYAVVQLRKDNAAGSVYNMVGFQTHLKFPEQKRIFRMIPGLEQAEFLRYGVMHRNTYRNSPQLLSATYECRAQEGLWYAGQMTGVEGYVESCSSGLVAGINAAHRVLGLAPAVFPEVTAIGALAHYISNPDIERFQPMNVNFGLLPPLSEKIRSKKDRYLALSNRALAVIDEMNEIKYPEIGEDLK